MTPVVLARLVHLEQMVHRAHLEPQEHLAVLVVMELWAFLVHQVVVEVLEPPGHPVHLEQTVRLAPPALLGVLVPQAHLVREEAQELLAPLGLLLHRENLEHLAPQAVLAVMVLWDCLEYLGAVVPLVLAVKTVNQITSSVIKQKLEQLLVTLVAVISFGTMVHKHQQHHY